MQSRPESSIPGGNILGSQLFPLRSRFVHHKPNRRYHKFARQGLVLFQQPVQLPRAGGDHLTGWGGHVQTPIYFSGLVFFAEREWLR